jgi:hypothetical protein
VFPFTEMSGDRAERSMAAATRSARRALSVVRSPRR